jgi:hypothetical protein
MKFISDSMKFKTSLISILTPPTSDWHCMTFASPQHPAVVHGTQCQSFLMHKHQQVIGTDTCKSIYRRDTATDQRPSFLMLTKISNREWCAAAFCVPGVVDKL